MNNIQVTLDYEQNQIFESITDKAAYQLVDKIRHELEREVKQRVSGAIDEQLNTIIAGVFERKFTPVDRFGDAKGDETSIKEIIAKKSDEFLSEVVDSSGKKADHYSSAKQPRVNFIIGQLVKESMDAKTQTEIKKLAENAKERAMQQVAELIVKAVMK